jgi:hypothetical protein
VLGALAKKTPDIHNFGLKMKKKIPFFSYAFLHPRDHRRSESGGLNHVIGATVLNARKIITFVVSTLLVKVGQQRNTQTHYLR